MLSAVAKKFVGSFTKERVMTKMKPLVRIRPWPTPEFNSLVFIGLPACEVLRYSGPNETTFGTKKCRGDWQSDARTRRKIESRLNDHELELFAYWNAREKRTEFYVGMPIETNDIFDPNCVATRCDCFENKEAEFKAHLETLGVSGAKKLYCYIYHLIARRSTSEKRNIPARFQWL